MKIIFRFILIITVLIGIEVNALYLTEGKINNYFKTEKYHIKLNGNGGIFSKQDHIIVFQKHMTLPTPTKEGYTFSHYSSSTCDYLNEINDINKINNDELVAKWEITKYQIIYDLVGGESNELVNEYTIEDEFVLPIPKKENSTFLGWTTNDNLIPKKELKVLKGTSGDLYFKANWQEVKYKIEVVSMIDNNPYNKGKENYTYNVWINDELIQEDVYYFEEEFTKGTKVRIQTISKDGFETTYDKTIIVENDYIFYPEWTLNEYNSEFYVGNYLAGITKNKFGEKVETPYINLENFGYSNYFVYVAGFTPRETWYQKAYTLYFDTDIGEYQCMASFGSDTLNNAYYQLSILQQNGVDFCGVNPSWNAVECHGKSSKVLDIFHKGWDYLPYSGNGFSRYKQLSCNSGYSTYYNR